MSAPLPVRTVSSVGAQLAAKAVAAVAGLGSVYVLTRALGIHGYGVYAAAMSFVALVAMVADGGIPIMTARDVATSDQLDASTYIGRQLAGRLLLSVVTCCAALALAIALFRDQPGFVTAVMLLLPGLPALAVTSTVASALQGASLLRRVAVVEAVVRIMTFLALLAAVHLGGHVGAVLVVGCCGWAVQCVFLVLALPPALRPRFVRNAPRFRDMLKRSIPLGMAAVLNVIYFRVDAVMLASMSGARAAAQYALAYRFLDMVLVLPSTFGSTMLPALARAGKSKAQLESLLSTCLRLTLLVMTPIAVIAIVGADRAVDIVGSNAFAASGGVLRVLILAAWFSSVDILLGLVIIVTGIQGRMLWLNVGALVANVLGNLVLIPRMGPMGAAIMTAACEGAVMIVAAVALRRIEGIRIHVAGGLRIGAALGVFGTVLVIGAVISTLLVALLPAVATYLAALYVLGLVGPGHALLRKEEVAVHG